MFVARSRRKLKSETSLQAQRLDSIRSRRFGASNFESAVCSLCDKVPGVISDGTVGVPATETPFYARNGRSWARRFRPASYLVF